MSGAIPFVRHAHITASNARCARSQEQVKPHLFQHTKHRISQLQTLLGQRKPAAAPSSDPAPASSAA